MEEPKEEQPQPFIIDQLKEYAETRIKLAKYKAIDEGTSIAAGIIVEITFAICVILAFVFLSITLALFLAHVLNSNWEGFGCVALMYLLIAVLVNVCKKNLEKPLIDSFINKILNKK